MFKAALIGNPNCGKTLLFNKLTGSNQRVANFPGITVAKKAGHIIGTSTDLTDLPGIYSLSSFSQEEIVTRDFLTEERPDFIINILDGTNLARNLYLTLQLLEINIPVILVINMADEMKRLNIAVNYKKLSEILSVNVISISAKDDKSFGGLLSAVRDTEKIIAKGTYSRRKLTISPEIDRLKSKLENIVELPSDQYRDFYAVKLLAMDKSTSSKFNITKEKQNQIDTLIHTHLDYIPHNDHETFIAFERYHFIDKVIEIAVSQDKHENMHRFSDKIDRVLTHRIFGIPIFVAVMTVVFAITFGPAGNFFQNIVEFLIESVSDSIYRLLTFLSAPAWFESFLIDGIIGGVGGVFTFLPRIAILFLLLSLLEDTGYMSRVAFLLDRLFRGLGLSGKAFIPMLLGFGCSTPAAMATRTLDNEKDRRLTLFMLPFMSCSAKIPVYVFFAGIFFPSHTAIVMTFMYFLGIAVAVVCAVFLKNTVFKGVNSPFVLEIPPYRIPSAKSICKQVWEKVKHFLIKAGTIIFGMSVIIWVLQSFDFSFAPVENSQSILGTMGKMLAPAFTPLGFGNWQSAVAVLTGTAGKEIMVSTFGILLPGDGIASLFTAASALSFMTFTLLFIPCISAMVTISKELQSKRWTVGLILWQFGVAYLVSLILYTVFRRIF